MRTGNLLQKWKVALAGRRFLVWKGEVFYQERDDALFKEVLSGRVLKGLSHELNTEQVQITSVF